MLFLLGALCGVILFGLGPLFRIAPELGLPGVILTLPLHNLIRTPLWVISCAAAANGLCYGLLFLAIGRLTKSRRRIGGVSR